MQYLKFVILGLTLLACEGKDSGGSKTKTDPKESPAVVANTELCKDLNSISELGAEYKDFIEPLCGSRNLLAEIRQSAYKGSGEPSIGNNNKQLDNDVSEIFLWGSIYTKLDTKSYYNLTRLQMQKPQDYQNEKFEADANVQYTVQAAGTDFNYNYKNDDKAQGTASVMEYKGNTRFKIVKAGQTYVILSKLVEKIQEPIAFRGMIVVNARTEDGGQTEAISMASYKFNNNKNHEELVRRSLARLRDETARSYKNTIKDNIQNVNKYFQD